MDKEKELGRYKKKVSDQQKEIKNLKEEVLGYQQTVEISNAMVAAAALKAGRLTFGTEDIARVLQGKVVAHVAYDATIMAYTVKAQEVIEDGGEETS